MQISMIMSDVPVCVFVYKRPDLVEKLINALSEIRPSILYVMSDGPREEKDMVLIEEVRLLIDNMIDWDCKVYKMYSEKNVGVYGNIALKIRDFFKDNDVGIFLEEDNLPSRSLMEFMTLALEKYEHEEQVLWINGSNLLLESDFGEYIGGFTKKLQPCGWASWGYKFVRYYNWDLDKWGDRNYRKRIIENLSGTYQRVRYFRAFSKEYENHRKGKRYSSWDHHMYLTLLEYDLLGFTPKVNLIENTGVDERSEHGGFSAEIEGTSFYAPHSKGELNLKLPYPKVSDVKNYNERFDKEFETKSTYDFGWDYKLFDLLVVTTNLLIMYRLYSVIMKIIRS